MDQKTWLRGKLSPQKSIALNSEAEISVKQNEKKVACLLCECNVKDKLVTEHAKTAQETNSGRERPEALVAANERLVHLNAVLKNYRQQLSFLKIEQDRRENLERAHKRLESKYIEAKKKLANLTVENARLTKALVNQEEIIKNVNNQMSEATAEFNALVSKIRRRHADVANRQQLEAERQKLRLLVRKRVPQHPKSNLDNHSKAVDKRASLIIKQLSELKDENMVFKENACKKENEIRLLKAQVARMRCDEHNNDNLSMNQMNDQFENLKLINFDLDDKLSLAKVQIKDAFQKISFLEMELEDKIHYCEELEATCLELQLQLTSISSKDVVIEYLEQEEKMLQTGLEITADLTNNKKSTHHPSLREVLLNPPMIKEVIKTTETKEPCIVVPRALPIVQNKKRGKRIEYLRRFLFRGKRGRNKKKLLGFAAYKI